jgi:hypothetical protein
MKLVPLLAAALALAPLAARAGSPVRYALVVGNNAADPRVVDIEPLAHAEREAREIADDLVRWANFDADRVETIVGGRRQDVLAAARRLAERHRRDRQELGDVPALFAFFFTGHGVSGRLVTADGALSGDDLATIVGQMDTTLTLGFFDACYAGSLATEALRGKGVNVTPGFNPVRELPKEILESEGTMWFVSSRENEVSYEDERMGGLFMHFLSEAFTRADTDGVGVSLETMWEYARRRTAEVASRKGRVQTPEKIVRSLKARGPLYFSFPHGRASTLRFEAAVEGTFLVQYVNAELTERVEKRAGAPLDIAAFEGEVVLRRVAGGAPGPFQRFTLGRGELVTVRDAGGREGGRQLGWSENRVRAKGELPGLELARAAAAPELVLGAGYRFGPVRDRALGAAHQLVVDGRVLRGRFSGGLTLGLGAARRSFPSWSYELQELGLQAALGYGLPLGRTRLDLEAAAGPTLALVRYGDGSRRTAWGAWAGGAARLTVPIPARRPRVLAWARGALGVAWAPGIAAGDRALRAAAAPQASLGIAVPFGGRGEAR